jgi:biopolymer transport protein ExbB
MRFSKSRSAFTTVGASRILRFLGILGFLLGFLSLEAQLSSQEVSASAGVTATASPSATGVSPGTAVSGVAGATHEVVSGGWLAKLRQGGTTALVQLGLSVFGAMFALERFLHLRRKYIVPPGLTGRARELWKQGKFEELELLAEREPSTLARVISFIVRNRHENLAEVSVMAGDIASQELKLHAQRAYPLGVIATLEPLLGLLGMILGMIATFEVVAIAGSLGDPSQLATGISESLMTTGLGLAIAIPFLSLHHFFKNRIGFFGASLEKEVTGLLSEWFFKKNKGVPDDAH